MYQEDFNYAPATEDMNGYEGYTEYQEYDDDDDDEFYGEFDDDDDDDEFYAEFDDDDDDDEFYGEFDDDENFDGERSKRWMRRKQKRLRRWQRKYNKKSTRLRNKILRNTARYIPKPISRRPSMGVVGRGRWASKAALRSHIKANEQAHLGLASNINQVGKVSNRISSKIRLVSKAIANSERKNSKILAIHSKVVSGMNQDLANLKKEFATAQQSQQNRMLMEMLMPAKIKEIEVDGTLPTTANPTIKIKDSTFETNMMKFLLTGMGNQGSSGGMDSNMAFMFAMLGNS